MKNKKLNITVIWWGSGTFNVLFWLKRVFNKEDVNLSAIIAMTDSWGTAWEIRDKYGTLPPGDVRRAIAALAEDTGMVRSLFEYRFENECWVIGWNKIWNILLTALSDIKWSFEAWLDAACRMFWVRWNVIPVTLEDVHLWVTFDDWTKVVWEKNIDVSDTNPGEKTHNTNQNIKEAYLVWWKWQLNPRAEKSILDSDIIILGPWDFYTSIVPNLLSKWMKEVLSKTDAKIVYVCNIMADKWETTHYELPDFIENIEKYAWDVLDYVLVNNAFISEELVEKYKKEGKRPVKLKEDMDFSDKKFQLIENDFLNESDYVRHDPIKLAKSILEITRKD